MSIEFSSVVDHPVAEVFAWHERPGAFARLVPPWQPVRLVEEASPLATGRAVIRLPGGLRWVAQHRDYEPPHRFVDELVSLPLAWRHAHEFGEEAPGRTRVTDRVTTPVPARLLRPMFAYRHRQLADDLAAQRGLRRFGATPLTVAVTGSSGLVGSALCALLTTGGHRVVRLVRRAPRRADERRWQPEDPGTAVFEGVDAVIHLAGASIAGRLGPARRGRIAASRLGPTRRLAEALAAMADGPRVLVCASAIGAYGPDRGDERLGEDAALGGGFLAQVVRGWEAATAPAAEAGIRVAMLRTGIVQSTRGGMLRLVRPLFLAGLGGPIGDGGQWMSWIDLDDLTDAYARVLLDDRLAGPINAVSPHPVRNREYAATLAGVLGRPALLPVPSAALHVLAGRDAAREIALASQRVVPEILSAAGFRFRRPALADCLAHQCGRF